MYQAYIDDSDSYSIDEKPLILAGYIHTKEAWADFSRDWTAVLAMPPALKSVHMCVGFPGNNNKERDAKIDALVAVLDKYRPLSFQCIVSRRDYDAFVRPAAPHLLRHAYFPCFVASLFAVAGTAREERLSGTVELIYDKQGEIGEDAARMFEGIKYLHPELGVLAKLAIASKRLRQRYELSWH